MGLRGRYLADGRQLQQFGTMNGNFRRGFNPEPHSIPGDAEKRDDDVAANVNTFGRFPC